MKKLCIAISHPNGANFLLPCAKNHAGGGRSLLVPSALVRVKRRLRRNVNTIADFELHWPPAHVYWQYAGTIASDPAYCEHRRASAASRPVGVSFAHWRGSSGYFSPLDGEYDLASSVNLRSGLAAVGALRPEEGAPQDPVSLETTVIATGARPGDTGTKRELFTEETQTVLVFENGAVIRLSAAVADGQLLFLTNKATGKEVVTQVLRKRSFRPTNCYIDLEFTEPCPGFWGIEFPKSAKPAKVSTPNSVTEKLSGDENSVSGADRAAMPASVQEVQRLKMEVAGLQTQVKSQLPRGENALAATAQSDVEIAAQISAEVARKEQEKRLEELFALETKQEQSNLPKRLVAYPQKSASRAALKKSISKSLVAALVVALAAAGANWFGAFDGLTKKTAAAKAVPSHAMLPAPVASAQKMAVASLAPSPNNDSVKASAAPA